VISFRFHLISLVAIFLALGLGVLTGTTVLNRGIVDQLERQTDQLAAQASDLRETVQRLEVERSEWNRFAQAVSGSLIEGRLEDLEVVLVTQEGTDPTALGGTRDALASAGASLRMQLSANGRMTLADDGDVAALADLLGMRPTVDADQVSETAARRLADQLSFGTAGTDVLGEMEEAGFLVHQGDESIPRTPETEVVIVVVAGGPGDPVIDPATFLIPMVERLALNGQAVVASEPRATGYEFVTVLREGDVSGRIVTQDNVGQIPGEVGLVLGVERLVAEGEAGHYGVKAGAAEFVPAAP
jgi:hypothetical protein